MAELESIYSTTHSLLTLAFNMFEKYVNNDCNGERGLL